MSFPVTAPGLNERGNSTSAKGKTNTMKRQPEVRVAGVVTPEGHQTHVPQSDKLGALLWAIFSQPKDTEHKLNVLKIQFSCMHKLTLVRGCFFYKHLVLKLQNEIICRPILLCPPALLPNGSNKSTTQKADDYTNIRTVFLKFSSSSAFIEH
jgi:hypothetical protein